MSDKTTTTRKLSSVAKVRNLKAVRKVQFKFKILPRTILLSQELKLKRGGSVRAEVRRNTQPWARILQSSSEPAPSDNQWNCRIERWTADVHHDNPVLFNSNLDALYPGAIFRYESIANGSYQSITDGRKPLIIKINRTNASKAMATVARPSSGTVQQAMADIRGSMRGQGAAITAAEAFEVLSEEHLFLSTGGSGYFLGFGGNHSADYTSNSKSYKYYISLVQEYYTMSVDDSANEPGDFFFTKEEAPNKPDAIPAALIDPNWVVVDSVRFGRVMHLLFESDESFESYGIDIHAYGNVLAAGASLDLDMRQKSFMRRCRVKLLAYGGNPAASAEVLNLASETALPQRISQYFAGTNDEVAIAYSLSTLDGANIGVRLVSDFTSRHCAPRSGKFEVVWQNVHCKFNDDGSDGEDIRAMVRIRAFDGQGRDILDKEKKNQQVLMVIKQNKQSPLDLPVPWTFTKGSEQHPLQLNTGETRNIDQRLIFEVDKNDAGARLGIRADVLEYDDFSNDDFADDVKSIKFHEVGDQRKINLVCNHEASRIEFNFMVYPVFD